MHYKVANETAYTYKLCTHINTCACALWNGTSDTIPMYTVYTP